VSENRDYVYRVRWDFPNGEEGWMLMPTCSGAVIEARRISEYSDGEPMVERALLGDWERVEQ
jgi:hypothetical protein